MEKIKILSFLQYKYSQNRGPLPFKICKMFITKSYNYFHFLIEAFANAT